MALPMRIATAKLARKLHKKGSRRRPSSNFCDKTNVRLKRVLDFFFYTILNDKKLVYFHTILGISHLNYKVITCSNLCVLYFILYFVASYYYIMTYTVIMRNPCTQYTFYHQFLLFLFKYYFFDYYFFICPVILRKFLYS